MKNKNKNKFWNTSGPQSFGKEIWTGMFLRSIFTIILQGSITISPILYMKERGSEALGDLPVHS